MMHILGGSIDTVDHHDLHALGLRIVSKALVLASRQLTLAGACQVDNI